MPHFEPFPLKLSSLYTRLYANAFIHEYSISKYDWVFFCLQLCLFGWGNLACSLHKTKQWSDMRSIHRKHLMTFMFRSNTLNIYYRTLVYYSVVYLRIGTSLPAQWTLTIQRGWLSFLDVKPLKCWLWSKYCKIVKILKIDQTCDIWSK